MAAQSSSNPEKPPSEDIDPDSSKEEDSEWLFGKLLNPDQVKLQESFRNDNEVILKYLMAMKALTESLQKVNVSGNSYHFDEGRGVPYSGWRYLSGIMNKHEYVGKRDKAEAESLKHVFNQIGYAEEKTFALIRNPDEKSNIYLAAGLHRDRMEKLNEAIGTSLKTCNRRRKKVEKAAIIADLRDQGPKYKAAMLQLDSECRELEDYKVNVHNNLGHHHNHIKRSLCITMDLCKQKAAVVKKEMKERPKSPSGNKSVKGRERGTNTDKSKMERKK